MEKNKLLKVSSILLIIGGAGLALLGLIFLLASGPIAKILEEAGMIEGGADVIALAVIIMGILYLVLAIFYIIAGALGVKQKSAKACFIIAIVLMVVAASSAIGNIITGNFLGIAGIVIPILFLVGAIQLKKASDAAAQESFNTDNGSDGQI